MWFSDLITCMVNPHSHGHQITVKFNSYGVCEIKVGPGSSVGVATRYELGSLGTESQWGRDFPYTSRPALVPTQLLVQWVPRLSPG
jgi:hypothetical protein